jgi:sialate O-acetylesterase
MKRFSLALLATLSVSSVLADIRLPRIISDGMVLQRDMPAPIWGKAEPGEDVSVTFAGQTRIARTGDSGRWIVTLDALKASTEPREMLITSSADAKRLIISDILVGEVWLTSGQSNLEMNLQILPEEEKKVASTQKNNKRIRMFVSPEHFSLPAPLFFSGSRNSGYWSAAPDFIDRMEKDELGPWYTHGSVPFFFLMKLQETLGVPVAVLDICWGGTPVERWISDAGYEDSGEEFRKQSRYSPVTDDQKDQLRTKFRTLAPKVIAWAEAAEDAAQHGEFNPFPYDEIQFHGRIKAVNDIYNGMIFPIVPYALRGTLWYQGEHNYRAGNYYDGLRALVNGWRKAFKSPDMPFILIMIAPFNGYGEKGREAWQMCDNIWAAEMKAADTINRCYTFPIHDTLGPNDDTGDIHPKWKMKVGVRAADNALRYVYGKKGIPAGGLRFAEAKRGQGGVIVRFKGIEKGLEQREGKPLSWFELSADNETFVKAKAVIAGKEVIVTAENMPAPKYVRMGWLNVATPNIQDKSGVPVFPFPAKEIE